MKRRMKDRSDRPDIPRLKDNGDALPDTPVMISGSVKSLNNARLELSEARTFLGISRMTNDPAAGVSALEGAIEKIIEATEDILIYEQDTRRMLHRLARRVGTVIT